MTMSSMYAITIFSFRFTIFRCARDMARWKVSEEVHIQKGIRRHSNKPSSQAKAVFCLSALRAGINQRVQAKSKLVEILTSTKREKLSSMHGRGYASFIETALRGESRKTTTTHFFDHQNPTRPKSQRGLDHAQSHKIAYLLIGALCFLLMPPRCSLTPGSTSTGYLANVQRPMFALCFMNRSSNSVRTFFRESPAV